MPEPVPEPTDVFRVGTQMTQAIVDQPFVYLPTVNTGVRFMPVPGNTITRFRRNALAANSSDRNRDEPVQPTRLPGEYMPADAWSGLSVCVCVHARVSRAKIMPAQLDLNVKRLVVDTEVLGNRVFSKVFALRCAGA